MIGVVEKERQLSRSFVQVIARDHDLVILRRIGDAPGAQQQQDSGIPFGDAPPNLGELAPGGLPGDVPILAQHPLKYPEWHRRLCEAANLPPQQVGM